MDQAALQALFTYDPNTGLFVRRVSGRGQASSCGSVAGTTNGKGIGLIH